MEGTRVCDICGVEHPRSELLEFGDVAINLVITAADTIVRCSAK